MEHTPIITLLTDFGLKDPYVAEMKGTILSICPEARIVDITHMVNKYDIRMGAYMLARSSPHFPKGTIHVAVVDPGVGTERKPIIIESERSFYVGPDNGLMTLAARREGIKAAYIITKARYLAGRISRTFHGRDIFSRVAAHIAMGKPPNVFGPMTSTFVQSSFSVPTREGEAIVGQILYVDDFGNLITNISFRELENIGVQEGHSISILTKNGRIRLELCSSYGEVPIGEKLAIIGSDNFLEISINQGNASKTLNLKVGDEMTITHLD